jgi:uncharacterized protein YcbX
VTTAVVGELICYPIKGCAGSPTIGAVLTEAGLAYAKPAIRCAVTLVDQEREAWLGSGFGEP